jgi:hypothetical protein
MYSVIACVILSAPSQDSKVTNDLGSWKSIPKDSRKRFKNLMSKVVASWVRYWLEKTSTKVARKRYSSFVTI